MKSAPLEKKLNTQVSTREPWIVVRLYDTEIVKFTPQLIRLDSGGHPTVTTKRRINETAARFLLPIKVHSIKHIWYVTIAGNELIPFYDGVTISRDRSQPHPGEYDEAAALAAAEKQRYNGWANRPTWNVFLWLNNDPGLYNRYRSRINTHGEFTPKSARSFCFWLWPHGRTPDGDALNRANWIEITAALNER